MIELTGDQVRLLSEAQPSPPRLLNPHTNEAFVLLGLDEYRQLTEDGYDDSPWAREEIQAAAWQVAKQSDRDGDDGDTDPAEQP